MKINCHLMLRAPLITALIIVMSLHSSRHSSRVSAFTPALTCAGTKNWIAAIGFWENAANWSGGTLPGPSDDVCIPAGVTVTLSSGTHNINSLGSSGTLIFSGGSLTIAGSLNSDGAVTISGGAMLSLGSGSSISNTLTLDSGTLTGSGSLDVSGLLTSTAGTISGAGTTNANGGMSISGGTLGLDARTLNNNGSATFTTAAINMANGAVFNNSAGSTFDAQGSTLVIFNGNTLPAFNNAGTFRKSAGGNTTFDAVPFNNSGTVDVQSGALQLNGGGTHTGPFTGASGATLSLGSFSGASHTFAATATITAANLSTVNTPPAYTINIASTYNVTNTTTVSYPSTLNLNGPITNLGSTLTINAGTANINSSPATPPSTLDVGGGLANFNFTGGINVSSLNFSGGTISGPTTMTVSGFFTSTAGTLSGAGTTNANGGMSISGGTLGLDARTLNNNGNATFTTAAISMANNAIFNNSVGSTFDAQGFTLITVSGGSTTFNNAGSFRKTGGGNTTFDAVPFNNSGTVEVQSGALQLDGGGTHTGPFTGASGATLSLGSYFGGTHTFTATANIVVANLTTIFTPQSYSITIASTCNVTDSTNIGYPGTLSLNGPITNLGSTLTVNGGTANINSSPATPPSTLTVTGGLANFNFTGGINVSTLNFSGGTISGPTTMTVSGLFTSTAGTLSGAGTTNANGGMSISGGTLGLDARTLNNNGPATFTNAAISMANGADFNNSAGSTFDAQGFTLITVSGGVLPAFNNAGAFRKVAGAGTTTFDTVPLNNTGMVEVQSGTLALTFGAPYTQSAGSTILNGGNISTNTTLNIQGGTLSGAGTITGNVSNGGTVAPGASPGIMNITGNYIQTSTGALNIEIGGLTAGTQFDRLNITGTTTLDGTLTVTRLNNFFPHVGNSFQAVTFASHSGTFAAINGLIFCDGLFFEANLGSTSLDIVAAGTESADLALTVSGSPATVSVGDMLTYTITITNNQGPACAPSAVVTDNLPASVTFVSCRATNGGVCSGTGNNRNVTFGPLAANASATVTVIATVNCLANGAIISNVASVSASSPDPAPGNNSATAMNASNPPLSVTSNPADQLTCVGEPATFMAAASGVTPIGIQWQVSTDGTHFNNVPGEMGSTLTFTTSMSQNGNKYRAVFTNACTTATTTAATLTVDDYSVAPTDKSFTAANGGTGNIDVTAAPGCTWNAVSNVTWVTISSGGGMGNGTAAYSVAQNLGATNRSGTITIANHDHTVLQGAAFLDVPPTHLFYTEIGKLSARGITVGCGGGNYCPEAFVTREQMAAFIMRALGEFNPPTPASQRFNDVPTSNIFYNFIDRLAALGITLGCGNGNYCPSANVTREQMAAFMIRALGEFDPPTPPTQRFNDVPSSNIFFNFIDRMAARGITFGCSASPPLYCPGDSVTRGQMAAFLVRAFSL
jgi:uncharacterized repeat protein (TIGR01451 family)